MLVPLLKILSTLNSVVLSVAMVLVALKIAGLWGVSWITLTVTLTLVMFWSFIVDGMVRFLERNAHLEARLKAAPKSNVPNTAQDKGGA